MYKPGVYIPLAQQGLGMFFESHISSKEIKVNCA
jgi:hypothetical protein